MFRIDTATATGSLPTPAVAGTPGYFQNATPGVNPATQLDQDFFNSLQEEFMNLLDTGDTYGVGVETPNKATYDQIKTQIEKFVVAYVTDNAGGSSTEDVTQSTHGFAKYDVIRHNGTIFTKAQADTESNAEAVGIVSAVADTDNFTVTYGGLIEWNSPPTPDYTLGERIYLSEATAGLLTITKPTLTVGEVDVVLGTATVGGLLVEIDKGVVEEATSVPSSWNSTTSKTADYTLLAGDDGDLVYLNSSVSTDKTFTLKATPSDKDTVWLYNDNLTSEARLTVSDGVDDILYLGSADGVYKFVYSSIASAWIPTTA